MLSLWVSIAAFSRLRTLNLTNVKDPLSELPESVDGPVAPADLGDEDED